MPSATQEQPQLASGQAHTPNQSFSDSPHAQQALSAGAGAGAGGSGAGSSSMAPSLPIKPGSSLWGDRKFLEDYEQCKARMSDNRFNIRKSCLAWVAGQGKETIS